jgi:hypothetical protein
LADSTYIRFVEHQLSDRVGQMSHSQSVPVNSGLKTGQPSGAIASH